MIKKPLSKRIDQLCDAMELSIRSLLGGIFALIFAGIGYTVGTTVWAGIGIMLAIVAMPMGFIFGFFVQEIILLFKLLIDID